MKTTSWPSRIASELDFLRLGRESVEHGLHHRDDLVGGEIGRRQHQHARRQRERLAVTRDEPAGLGG